MIEDLFKYYLEHQDELVSRVVGAYDSLTEGYEVALKTYGKSNFML